MNNDSVSAVHEAPNRYMFSLIGAWEIFSALVAALWNPAGAISERQKELVFLRTSLVNRCEP
jgi:hypothetical protein